MTREEYRQLHDKLAEKKSERDDLDSEIASLEQELRDAEVED